MYYPLKEQDKVYRIDCSLYKQKIWALTWEDVLSLMEKTIGWDYEIKYVDANNLVPGAAIILGIKDKRQRGDYSIEEFGGWLETVESKPKVTNSEEKKNIYDEINDAVSNMRERLKEYDWCDKFCDNYRIRLCCDLGKGTEGEIENVRSNIEHLQKFTGVYSMLPLAFAFRNTPEGYEYWYNIAIRPFKADR